MLSGRFRNTPRAGQEAFILRMSQAITIGSAGLIALFVYPFLPTLVRVFALPVVLVLSWLLGTKLVAPQMMSRVESYLNQSDFYPE